MMTNRRNYKPEDDWLKNNHPELVQANENSRDIRGWYAEQCYKKQMPVNTTLNTKVKGMNADIDAIEPKRGKVEVKFGTYNLKTSLSKINDISYYYVVRADKVEMDNIHYKTVFYEDNIVMGITLSPIKRVFWLCPDLELAKQNIHRIFKYKEAEYVKFK